MPVINGNQSASDPDQHVTPTGNPPATSGTDFQLYNYIASYFKSPLDIDTISLSYLTEGAANVIWRIHSSSPSILHDQSSALVLRMRKDIPSTTPMIELQRQFNERIAPLFSHNLDLIMPVHLVEITQSLVENLNAQLKELEANGQRSEMRHATYHPVLQTEPFAMILPNLAYGDGTLVEFKPKWLVQSPSASRNARRCRTCALNAMRRAQKREAGRGDSGFCPFELLSDSSEVLRRALNQIWTDPKTLESFVEAFKTTVQPALYHLQTLQMQDNKVGLDDFQNPQGTDFSVAMALRDCSVVLKVVVSPNTARSSGSSNDDNKESSRSTLHMSLLKFIDLDLKQTGGGKIQKWAQTELDLLEVGWYTDTAQGEPNAQCALDTRPKSSISSTANT